MELTVIFNQNHRRLSLTTEVASAINLAGFLRPSSLLGGAVASWLVYICSPPDRAVGV